MSRSPFWPLLVVVSLPLSCGGQTLGPVDGGALDGAGGGDVVSLPGSDGGGGSDVGGTVGKDGGGLPPPTPTSKLDILFTVQNSPSMVGVSAYVQASVQALFDRLLNPNCIGAGGNVVGVSSGGVCSTGSLEFQPLTDIHIGIVTSSLGSRGGDVCPDRQDPSNPALSAHDNDNGELINRTDPGDGLLSDALPSNFLAWFPSSPQNSGQPPPPVAAIGVESQLVSDFQDMLGDTGIHGCGYPATLEAWYRFLVQPDPYQSVVVSNGIAGYSGVDATILQQRHDFLRPDSALAIVVVSVENERDADPLALAGQGWAFTAQEFPGSTNSAAPEGSIECQANPEDPNCTSCAFLKSDPNFATRCPDDPPGGTGGYLDPSDDMLNVRFFHMKQRFGIDVEYPIERYVTGLGSAMVPDSLHEHDANGNYMASANCDNPLFASNLPTSPTPASSLCNLAPGPRQPSQVFFAAIGGVPHQLLQSNPADPDSPQKAALSAADWTTILGADPLDYDFTGADFHMLESETPRMQSACPVTAADDCDPINGREWTTGKGDLQYACVFPLVTPLDCSQAANAGACACVTASQEAETPLCQKDSGGNYTQTQTEGAAYPTIRVLALARELGSQAAVSSVCPIHTTEATPGDPLYAYRPAFTALVDRVATTLVK